ncbi:MAG: hypothetical protein H7061_12985 [Bdellovibrionaceae bacterium]|nr:hypothetical protein [Bdellovibrio sp.]
MSHKKIAIVAVIMAIVFGSIVIVYPTMFKSEKTPDGQVSQPALPATTIVK